MCAVQVSKLSFGSWVTFSNQVDVQAAYGLMKVAYASGINFFDNAETYAKGKSEEIMGEAIKLGIHEKVWERDDLVVTTKIFFGTKSGVNAVGLSRKHVIEGATAALKRMHLDYVDVIFCHRCAAVPTVSIDAGPTANNGSAYPFRPDPYTPMEETVRAFNYLIDKGMTFYWATSGKQPISNSDMVDGPALIQTNLLLPMETCGRVERATDY